MDVLRCDVVVWIRKSLLIGCIASCAIAICCYPAFGQTPPEPGAAPFVETNNISLNGPDFSSVFPQVAVSPVDNGLVAVAWRVYGLPIDTNAPKEGRIALCYVSISTDAGQSFSTTNLMPYLRRERISAAEPALWGCNAPWVAISPDSTIYAGGALFTELGDVGPEPKQGRARLTVSTDGGRSWRAGTHGISFDRFAPGVTGTQGGTNPENTPWDGPNGFVDPQTNVFYSTAGSWVVASSDHAESFGTVYQLHPQGWSIQRQGSSSAAFGTLYTAFIAGETPVDGAECPCLAVATSTDHGKTHQVHLVAEAPEFNPQGTIRHPIVVADSSNEGHIAIATYTPDHESVIAFFSDDAGRSWDSATVTDVPENIRVDIANQVGVGFSSDGELLLTWRWFRPQGAFNTFVAMLGKDGEFGDTVKVSDQPSVYPPLTYLGNYGRGNGGGDYTTWITGNGEYAFVVYPYAPRGAIMDTYLARIPLSELR